jgi:hypothetical protein
MLEILKATKKKLPGLKPCASYITFRGVNALRKAAHELGHPARHWPTLSNSRPTNGSSTPSWVKLNEPTLLTDIAVKSKKWYGAHCSMVKNNVLEMTPSKTKEDDRQKDRRAVRRIPDGG